MTKLIRISFFFTLCCFITFTGRAQLNSSKDVGKGTLVESDMFTQSKKSELQKVQKDKKVLFGKIKKGDKKAEQSLKQLTKKESELKKDLEANLGHNELAFKTFKVIPRPPCPPKSNGKCALDRIKNLVVADNIKSIIAIIVDENGKKVGQLNSKPFLTKNGLKVFAFDMINKNISGTVTVKITRIDNNNKKSSYPITIELP
jgi:hypothetical protein